MHLAIFALYGLVAFIFFDFVADKFATAKWGL